MFSHFSSHLEVLVILLMKSTHWGRRRWKSSSTVMWKLVSGFIIPVIAARKLYASLDLKLPLKILWLSILRRNLEKWPKTTLNSHKLTKKEKEKKILKQLKMRTQNCLSLEIFVTYWKIEHYWQVREGKFLAPSDTKQRRLKVSGSPLLDWSSFGSGP